MGAKEISLDPQIINIMEMVIRGDLHQINSLTLQSILKNSANDYENKILLMVQAILERDKVLEEQAADLVKLVDQRTKELEQQKIINIQTSKMSALGEMAGGIAHEINTPLATMKMLINLAQKELDKDIFEVEIVTERLTKINLTIDRIAKIVRGLKTFSRDGSGDPFSRFSLKKIIEDTIDLCREKIKHKDVLLEVHYPEEEVCSLCRDIQISQVLINLINNSIDAIEMKKEKWIKIVLRTDDIHCYIEVTDSGPGIPLEIQHRMFEPFFTTKDVQKGTGLGLSISHGILKDHQGDLSVNNNSPNTSFIIKLKKCN